MKYNLSAKKSVALAIIVLIVGKTLFDYHTAAYGITYPPDTSSSRMRESIFKIVQSLNPFANKLFLSPLEDIPEFDVDLSRKNIAYINGVIARGLDPTKNIYRPAGSFISVQDNNFTKDTKTKITYRNQEYKGKIKIHGVWHPNFKNKKKSYSIKFKKDALVENTRKISLAVPEKQFMGGLMSHELSEKYGYMTAEYGIARLKFNGIDQGLYFFEESLGKELLEKNGLSGYEVVKSMDEWSYQYKFAHYYPYVYDLSYRDFDNITGLNNGQLLLYNKLMHSEDYSWIESRIDFDKFARHEAMRAVFATYHSIEGDNLSLMLNTATGRFSPYFRTEGFVTRLKHSPLNVTFDRGLYGRYLADGTKRSDNKLFSTLIKNNRFRALRNKYLNDIVADKAEILNRFDVLEQAFQAHIENDFSNNYSLPYYRFRTKQQRRDIAYNLNQISNYLNYARAHLSIVQKSPTSLHINIKPDSNSPLTLSSLGLEGIDPHAKLSIYDEQSHTRESLELSELKAYFSLKNFMVTLDDQQQPQITNFNFEMNFDEDITVSAIQPTFINITTGKAVKQNNTFSRIVEKPAKFSLERSVTKKDLQARGLNQFSLVGKTITLHSGQSEIIDDIVLPHGYSLKIEGGSKIGIAPGKSILVNGNLTVDGRNNPVLIHNLVKNKPFGVVAAVGNGHTFVDISGLELYGGKEDKIDGMYLSGALSLYNHATVKITNSHIHHNSADDGLNIKGAEIYLQNNIFSKNYADQVDIDVSRGAVFDSQFLSDYPYGDFNWVDIPVDINGDGLDFSNSTAYVRGNIFAGFKDKGISIGERSNAYIYKNRFHDNRSAITGKDQSSIYLCGNNIDIKTNLFTLEAYQKKAIFEHPSVYMVCGNLPLKQSKITPQTSLYNLQKPESSESGFSPTYYNDDMFDKLKRLNWSLRYKNDTQD